MSLPRSGIAPELPPGLRAEQQLVAYLDSVPASQPNVERPTPRKRMVLRDRSARTIDNALRRRAIEAVERAIASQDSPA
jgi:hypothetical protein